MGYKVLLIDCDIQANASNLIPQKDRMPKTLTHVLRGEATFEETIQKARENLYLIAADSNLDKAANHIVISGIKGYKLLRNATKNLTGFDFVIFDHSQFYTAIRTTGQNPGRVRIVEEIASRQERNNGTERHCATLAG
jgi:cellulose biosynthesis protein BcsQ